MNPRIRKKPKWEPPTKDPVENVLMSFEDWRERGCIVRAGERHAARDQFGTPLFYADQVFIEEDGDGDDSDPRADDFIDGHDLF